MKNNLLLSKAIFFSLFFLISNGGFSQRLGWTQCYGGSNCEGCSDANGSADIIKTLDGGFAFVTPSESSDGDLTGNNGYTDYWIVKIDSLGVIQWQNNVGGSDNDFTYSIEQAPDSNYYVVGFTTSTDGVMSCNLANTSDFVLKLDPNGSVIHEKCLGGFGSETSPRLKITPDAGCIIISSTTSNDGDVSGNHGGGDIWLVKLDSSLNIQWQHCYGGTSIDEGKNIIITQDGGYIFTGSVRSSNGDLIINYGGQDIWLVKIDSVGSIEWQKNLGGSSWDYPKAIMQTTNKDLLIAGYTSSNDSTVSGNHGSNDAWVVKIDSTGNILWKHCFGGTLDDRINNMVMTTDNGFIISGTTTSNDYDVSGNQGIGCGWCFKIDSAGGMLWQRTSPILFLQKVLQLNSGNQFIIGLQQSCSYGSLDILLGEMNPSNFILGKVFVDYNSNSQYDQGEPLYQNAYVNSVNAGVDSTSSYSNLNGFYWHYPDTGTYVTSLSQGVRYYTFQPPQYVSSFSNTGQFDTLNFALTPIPGIHDLQLNLLPVTGAHVGWDVQYRLHYKNTGTDTSSGSVYLVKDSLLIFSSSIPVPDGISGDSIYWNYSSLLPFESRDINVIINVPIPPIVNGGDTLYSYSGILPSLNDSTPLDNFSSLSQIVFGSFDPNDKLVLSENAITPSQVASGDYITYMIRFQNTGNASATTIIVNDTISNFLDVNSLEIISVSHPYQLFRDQNMVTWSFNNIQLIDSSTNEHASHGYICYKIRPKTSVSAGTIIPNNASIVFDFNLPVVTNSANVYVINYLSADNMLYDKGFLSIYPNPTSGKTEVHSKNGEESIYKIIVMNILGEIIQEVNDSEFLNLENNPPGVYLIKVVTQKQHLFFAFLIKK